MTKYLETIWDKGEMFRECWERIQDHGATMTGAELDINHLREMFPAFEYTIRPVTDEEAERMVRV